VRGKKLSYKFVVANSYKLLKYFLAHFFNKINKKNDVFLHILEIYITFNFRLKVRKN
jgi:hypothetical protein